MHVTSSSSTDRYICSIFILYTKYLILSRYEIRKNHIEKRFARDTGADERNGNGDGIRLDWRGFAI